MSHPDDKAETPPYCSFCNRKQAEVRKLVAGPVAMICDECVTTCVDIIVDDARASGSAEDLPASQEMQARLKAHRINAAQSPLPVPDEAIPLWHVRCALCRQIVPTDAAMSIEGRGVLCESCLAAVRALGPDAGRGDQESR
jgi:hypothetical protein